MGVFENEELIKRPKKEYLDETCNDKAIILRAYDGHTVWLNTKAFEKFNIDINTSCSAGGKIEINEDSKELWGISPIVYKKLQKENKLKTRVSNSIMISPDEELKNQIDKLTEIRSMYDSDYFKTTTVKFLWENKKLSEAITVSNENRLSIHVHSVGDGSSKKRRYK